MMATTKDGKIAGFAKHYAIPYKTAEKCWSEAGGNWAKAFDLLVAMMKRTQ
jgi:hypothetical protein